MDPRVITGIEVDGVLYDLVRRAPHPDPDPDPDPEPEPVPNMVRIGNSATYPLAAVNPVRGPDRDYPGGRAEFELVYYHAPVTVTETNTYGWEVPVGVDGRAGVGQVNRTPVPPDGGVLSGHYGKTSPKAGEWLRTHAVPGAFVELVYVEPVDPPPRPVGTLPAWVTAGYWQQYEGPPVSVLTKQAPEYNMLFAAFATGGGGQSMTFRPVAQDDASFRRDLAASQERGVLWSLSIGGGVKAEQATVLRTADDARRCYDTLAPIIDSYGFQGVDDDLENGPSGFTEEGLTALLQRLRATYGPGFALSSTLRPYETWRVQIAANLFRQGLLDLLQWQLYDNLKYLDPAYLRDRALKEIRNAVAAGVPASAQVIGAITLHTYDKGWNTVDVYESVLREARTSLGVRGGFVWHTDYDREENWSFARRIGALGG